MVKNTEGVLKILLKDLHTPGPGGIVFFYDGIFHALQGSLILPITKDEAFKYLDAQYLLWHIKQIGRPEQELPFDCPEVMCKTIEGTELPGLYLNLLLRLDFLKKLKTESNDPTVSTN